MFKLTESELDAAFAAINHHGYSTMMPEPQEWAVVTFNWISIRSSLAQLDLDTYDPFEPMQVFSPKSRSSVRVLHLLHPQDLIIYTALVLIVKDDIECSRVPQKLKRVFSFRVDTKQTNTLYDSRGSYEAYRCRLEAKAVRSQVKFVAIADIADFYPRIYQHRLQNIVGTVAKSQRVREVARVLVRKLINNLMGRNSYGIPVGPYASRVLAEAILIDVDASLLNQRSDFVRWVDDYNIFCKSEYEAQSILFSLGEWLFVNHGLTLQSSKTRILTIGEYRDRVLTTHDAQLTSRDAVIRQLRDFQVDYEESDDDEGPDESMVQEALEMLQGHDLKGLLEASLSDTTLVDYEAVTYALNKLPRIPGAPSPLKREVLDLVIDNVMLLYPVAEHVAKYVLSFDSLTPKEQKSIAKKLLKSLNSMRNPVPPYCAMWMLSVFAHDQIWNHASDIASLYTKAKSEVIKCYAALAIHASGTRSEALAIKDDYASASPLLKLAILFASRRLGRDERHHWKLANGVSGIIERLI
ncbi:MAG: RNA-directed DNA polymerase [Candidatus Hydrogenedentes bacterium]|nr:RNA-directed DNA polymerase [Candidatus Hydrogenedentota bacterium]